MLLGVVKNSEREKERKMLAMLELLVRYHYVEDVPGLNALQENTTDGGFAPPALKKENGARLGCPVAEIVETNAMGRGATMATNRS